MIFFAIVLLFMGAVSATSLSVSNVEVASSGVKSYTEAHGNIPGYVDISSVNSTDQSFLYTMTRTTTQLNAGSTAPVTVCSEGNPTAPSGSGPGTVYKSEYVDIASNVNSFYSSNGRAPNYAISSKGNIRYESLVYMYANILDFYRYNNRLPNYVVVSNIAGIDSTGVTIDNVAPSVSNNLASGSYSTTKSVTLTATDHVDANPKVYYSTNSGSTWSYQTKTVTLNLAQGVTTLKYYGKDATGNTGATQTATYTIDLTTPTVTTSDPINGAINVPTNKVIKLTFNEPVKAGNMLIELIENDNAVIPINTSISGNILTITPLDLLNTRAKYTLNLNTGSITDLSNQSLEFWSSSFTTIKILNLRTNEWFTTLQEAIDDNETSDNDTITLSEGTYTENVVVYKKLTIIPVSGENVTIQAFNPNSPVFTITNNGSGSIIQNLIIAGSTGFGGIYINNSNNNTISGNTISNNYNGVSIHNSTGNLISGNTISNNSWDGISIDYGFGNTIYDNNITHNTFSGIEINRSFNNTTNNLIYGNTISNNNYYGINIYESSVEIKFNRILENGQYGLYSESSGVINASNNWWGSNNPTINILDGCDIFEEGGTINYNPWIKLNITSSRDHSVTGNASYTVTADLTHNSNGEDTSSGESVPDGIPVNFTTTFGTISTPCLQETVKRLLHLTVQHHAQLILH